MSVIPLVGSARRRRAGTVAAACLVAEIVLAAYLAAAPSAVAAPGPPAAAEPALGTAGTAGTAGNGAWSVTPVNRSDAPAARPFFTMEARPGTTVRDAVRIANLTTKPISFRLYGADAYNTPRDGGFALRTAEEPRRGVGGWITLRTGRLKVPARTAADVPFVVTVPADATPGEHIGGVVTLNEAIESVQRNGGARIGLRRAVAARIYLRVAGPISPGLRLDTLTVDRREPLLPPVGQGHGTLRYAVVNTGNLRLAPTARVWATGAFGRTIKEWQISRLPEILPGQRTEITVPWDALPPLDAVTVRVELTADNGVRTRTQNQFFVLPWVALLTLLGIVFVFWSVLPRLIRRWRIRSGLFDEDQGEDADEDFHDGAYGDDGQIAEIVETSDDLLVDGSYLERGTPR